MRPPGILEVVRRDERGNDQVVLIQPAREAVTWLRLAIDGAELAGLTLEPGREITVRVAPDYRRLRRMRARRPCVLDLDARLLAEAGLEEPRPRPRWRPWLALSITMGALNTRVPTWVVDWARGRVDAWHRSHGR